jgi:hypothetical protein
LNSLLVLDLLLALQLVLLVLLLALLPGGRLGLF